MKFRTGMTIVFTLAALLAIGSVLYAQSYNHGMGNGGWYCPRTGQYVNAPQAGGWYCPGPGRMAMAYGGGGYGYHRGRGYCAGYGSWGAQNQAAQPLTEQQATNVLQNYLSSTANPNLKLGPVTDKGDFYEAQIVTKDDSLVDTVQVSKQTGQFRFVR